MRTFIRNVPGTNNWYPVSASENASENEAQDAQDHCEQECKDAQDYQLEQYKLFWEHQKAEQEGFLQYRLKHIRTITHR